ncbi:signal peptidase I [Sediminivirga luteola]|uniref:Signal peptidase I n=1 Tax=Sediminivirga luteola TaxID=1774748 RepID=A0A8J2TVA5_9MICO|nr:signal peptidase I [Sediminivirga luteola]MCI2264579.1 signal peptidase I [Sediminivirga luteola]GGA03239.1 hypothetical protein GCM10011333_02410 [Sediminivirga luteola]
MSANSKKRPGWVAILREIAIVVVIALVVTFVVRTWLVRAFYIPSASMSSTLEVDDRVLANQLAPTLGTIDRGDIIVFNDPGGWLDGTTVAQYEPNPVLAAIGLVPADAGQQLIKRVIGVGGDTVECCDEEGRVTVNGAPLQEDYLDAAVAPSEMPFHAEVPPGHYWVMGDNRANSLDSRYNEDTAGGAFVPEDNVVGTAFLLNWPLQRFGIISNPDEVFAHVPEP